MSPVTFNRDVADCADLVGTNGYLYRLIILVLFARIAQPRVRVVEDEGVPNRTIILVRWYGTDPACNCSRFGAHATLVVSRATVWIARLFYGIASIFVE